MNSRVIHLWGAWLRSPSSRLSMAMGTVMYLSYAASNDAWLNPVLIAFSVFVALALPSYSKLSNKLEERTNFHFGLISLGRISRFLAQLLFNYTAIGLFYSGRIVSAEGLDAVGGVLGAAVLTTLASQGAQYLALLLVNRNVGDRNRNVLVALSANIVVTALALSGMPLAQDLFLVAGLVLGALVFGVGLLSDLRGLIYPRGGVGLFFGTFNPFHRTHLELVRQAIETRGLDKIVIHPTIVPRLHAQALERGEIHIAHNDGGLLVYERTAKADVNVDYFPTGNRFFAPETRRALIQLAIEEAGLADRVEVAFMPEIYEREGFFGVVREVRAAHRGMALHGIHGSDFGGMTVRGILDECGWIYPMTFLRRDGVSATAIRAGAQGMTSKAVSEVLKQLKTNAAHFTIGKRTFTNQDGVLSHA